MSGIDKVVLNRELPEWVGRVRLGIMAAGGSFWVSAGNIRDREASSHGGPSCRPLIPRKPLPKGFYHLASSSGTLVSVDSPPMFVWEHRGKFQGKP